MNATTLTTTARSVFSIATAALQAIAILTLAPESTRQREIAAAKRSIAERKAQLANRTAVIETELVELKTELVELKTEQATVPAPTPEPSPEPEAEVVPELEIIPAAIATATPQPAPAATKEPTIRELKALASAAKIKGYGKMTKAQLLEALKG